MKHTYLVWCAFLLTAFSVQAQKKALTPNDIDEWRSLGAAKISDNGRYLVYELQPGMADGALVISDLERNTTDTIARGKDARFSGDQSFITFSIEVPLAQRRKEETEKVGSKKKTRDSLGIFVLQTKKLIKYPENHGWSMPRENSGWLAYKTVVKTVEKDTAAADSTGVAEKPEKKKSDSLLVVMQPVLGDSLSFEKIKSYTWADEAGVLLMMAEDKDSTGTQSHLLRFTAAQKLTDTVVSKAGKIKGITTDKSGWQLAYLHTEDTTKIKQYQLYAGGFGKDAMLDVDKVVGKPAAWTINASETLRFSEDGSKLYFGTAMPKQEQPVDTLLNRERAKLDIWSWTDKQLQPMQLLNKKEEERRAFKAVYHFDKDKAVQLEDSSLFEVRLLKNGDARYALGRDVMPYQRAQSWSGLWINDFYLVDTESGERTLLAEAQGQLELGPDQKHALLYNRKDSIYYGIDLASGKHTPLTASLDVKFYNELHDTPSEPGAYGVAGWTKGDAYVFVYDRFDIWRLDLTGASAPVNMTKNGRETQTQYRYIPLDREEEYVPMDENVILSAFNEEDKRSGFAQTRLNKAKAPKLTFYDDHSVRFVAKAKESDKILYSSARFDRYPDLLLTDTRLRRSQKVTHVGDQMERFSWGTAKLVSWEGYNGVRLQGILYVPNQLEEGKKYPMISYFYERRSNNLHRFLGVTHTWSSINIHNYVSNGYVVFVPDVVYRDGEPGQSAYDCIVSGVEAMVEEFPFIDSNALALQGQSWGGYQTAYLITQTDKFAAAMAGAPVSNMTSAYGGIRWGSGMSRMFQYERTQSRIGVTLWENTDLYLKNSPLFYADKINTPLMMMHNDNDGAVPWYQGIEFFVALRRLDKPVWLVNYNGEPHNLKRSSWGNRKDLSIRMMQFFDHYLKGASAPEWMVKGRPAWQKDHNKAY